jgi:hypothetical protein
MAKLSIGMLTLAKREPAATVEKLDWGANPPAVKERARGPRLGQFPPHWPRIRQANSLLAMRAASPDEVGAEIAPVDEPVTHEKRDF